MNWEKAVEYCENHECMECPIYINNLDKRTEKERRAHIPCVINLVDKDKREVK